MKLEIILGDITKQSDVDAVVNAANTSGQGGGGVEGAIHNAAGPELMTVYKKMHGCNTGEAKITEAYNLPCKYIIHTVGPVYRGGNRGEKELLRNTYWNIMQAAVDHGIRSIAFPSISTGVCGYPANEASRIAMETIKEFDKKNFGKIDLVRFVMFSGITKQVYEKASRY